MLKKIGKALLLIFILIMGLPYVLPRDFSQPIPEMPYENSVFFTTADQTQLHGQLFIPETEIIGKMLMIHGLGASSFSYRNNAPYFMEKGYLVLAVDLPAFGFSSKQANLIHSQKQRASYIWEWLDALDEEFQTSSPWDLVGHSMGASTVLAMSNQQAPRVNTMNLIAGAVTNNNQSSLSWILSSPLGEWLRVALRYQIISEDSFASILEGAYQQTPTQADVLGYLRPLQVTGTTRALIDFVQTAENVVIQDLEATHIPINLFWGEKDTWVETTQIKIIQESVEVNEIHIFAEQGHCVHETDPNFNQVLYNALVKPSK